MSPPVVSYFLSELLAIICYDNSILNKNVAVALYMYIEEKASFIQYEGWYIHKMATEDSY